MKWSVGIAALALAAVSCAGGSPGAATGPTATPPPSPSATEPVAEGSYESVRAMQLDVARSFYLCNSPMKTYDPPVAEGALGQADCSGDVAFFIYEPDHVQAAASALLAEADGAFALLFGDNWIISCSSQVQTCEKIQRVTGGELITAP